jgi:hypothetical protein
MLLANDQKMGDAQRFESGVVRTYFDNEDIILGDANVWLKRLRRIKIGVSVAVVDCLGVALRIELLPDL